MCLDDDVYVRLVAVWNSCIEVECTKWVKHRRVLDGHKKSIKRVVKSGYSPDDIEAVIRYAATDKFWSSVNITLNQILRTEKKSTFEDLLEKADASKGELFVEQDRTGAFF